MRAIPAIATIASLVILAVHILAVQPRPLSEQPFPDAPEYADAAWQIAHGNGYVTYVLDYNVHDIKPRPPRYPPGFSLALAPFALVGDYPSNVQTGAKFFDALYLLITVISAWSVGGPLAATLSAAFIGTSPFVQAYATLVMSDAFATGLTVLSFWLILRPSTRRVTLAGVLSGVLVAVRLSSILNIVALFLALTKFRKQLLLSALPGIGALGLFQWATFGNPLKTGYDYWLPGLRNFDWMYAIVSVPLREGPWIIADALKGQLMQWVCPCPVGGPEAALPNIPFYLAVVLGFFWLFTPPFTPLLGMGYVWKHHKEAAPGFTLWLTILSFGFYAFYVDEGSRFMAAPVTLLGVYAAIVVAHWIEGKVNWNGWQKGKQQDADAGTLGEKSNTDQFQKERASVTANSSLSLSIIIPVYNEANTIQSVLERILNVPLPIREIIVVDDGSTDATSQIVKSVSSQRPCIRLVQHEHNQGKTNALKTGFAGCSGDIVVVQDADLEYDPYEIPALIQPIQSGEADVVYGSRFLVRRATRVLYFRHYLANRLVTFLSNLFTDLNLTDVETGYKAFRGEIIRNMVITSIGFGFEIEVTAKVAKLHCRVYEVPISYHGRTYEEGKKIGIWDGVAALWYILVYNLFWSLRRSYRVLPQLPVLKEDWTGDGR